MPTIGPLKLRNGLATACMAVSLSGFAIAAPTASAAGDPVASGSFELTLSPGFKKQLRRSAVKMTSGSLPVQDGSIDPTSGAGSVTLPSLRFQHGRKRLTIKGVTATLGAGGALKGKGTTWFNLAGGKVARNSFGASVTGVKVTLPGGAAHKLGRKLGLRAPIKGQVGTVNVLADPKTVEVIGGTVDVLGLTTPGSIAAKSPWHCVNPLTTITPIAPAVANGAVPPSFSLPVKDGTISPAGNGGLLQLSGGFRTQNNLNVKPGCSLASYSLTMDQTDISFDFAAGAAKSHMVISGKSSPPNGDQGTQFAFNLDSSAMTITADAAGHKVTSTGGILRLNKGAALYLNQVFPQPLSGYLSANEFVAGDPLGIVQMTLKTR